MTNNTKKSALVVLRDQLSVPAIKEELQKALPNGILAARFIRIITTAAMSNPYLLECDRASFMQAAFSAAQLGLLPDGVLGEAAFVPFKGRVTLLPMYRGLIKLAKQGGSLLSIDVDLIYDRDNVFQQGGDDHIFRIGIPNWDDRGEMIGAYAIAHLPGDYKQRAVMTKKEIDRIKDKVLSGKKNSPWTTDYLEMAKKTVIRRLLKNLPLSPDAHIAATMEDNQDAQFVVGEFDHGMKAPAIPLGDIISNGPPPVTVEMMEEKNIRAGDEVIIQLTDLKHITGVVENYGISGVQVTGHDKTPFDKIMSIEASESAQEA